MRLLSKCEPVNMEAFTGLCLKVKYNSRGDAIKAMNKIYKRNTASHNQLKVYQCEVCDDWHIATQQGKGKIK